MTFLLRGKIDLLRANDTGCVVILKMKQRWWTVTLLSRWSFRLSRLLQVPSQLREERDQIGKGVGDKMREEDCIVLVLESVGEREPALLFVLVNH